MILPHSKSGQKRSRSNQETSKKNTLCKITLKIMLCSCAELNLDPFIPIGGLFANCSKTFYNSNLRIHVSFGALNFYPRSYVNIKNRKAILDMCLLHKRISSDKLWKLLFIYNLLIFLRFPRFLHILLIWFCSEEVSMRINLVFYSI